RAASSNCSIGSGRVDMSAGSLAGGRLFVLPHVSTFGERAQGRMSAVYLTRPDRTVGYPHPPMPDPTAMSAAPLIRARGLTKRFGTFTAVDGVDFQVAEGESFGFLGPNGAGKTSTMRMIGC